MSHNDSRYFPLMSVATSWQRAFAECEILDSAPLEKIPPTIVGLEAVLTPEERHHWAWETGQESIFLSDEGPSAWDENDSAAAEQIDPQLRARQCQAIAILAAALIEATGAPLRRSS